MGTIYDWTGAPVGSTAGPSVQIIGSTEKELTPFEESVLTASNSMSVIPSPGPTYSPSGGGTSTTFPQIPSPTKMEPSSTKDKPPELTLTAPAPTSPREQKARIKAVGEAQVAISVGVEDSYSKLDAQVRNLKEKYLPSRMVTYDGKRMTLAQLEQKIKSDKFKAVSEGLTGVETSLIGHLSGPQAQTTGFLPSPGIPGDTTQEKRTPPKGYPASLVESGFLPRGDEGATKVTRKGIIEPDFYAPAGMQTFMAEAPNFEELRTSVLSTAGIGGAIGLATGGPVGGAVGVITGAVGGATFPYLQAGWKGLVGSDKGVMDFTGDLLSFWGTGKVMEAVASPIFNVEPSLKISQKMETIELLSMSSDDVARSFQVGKGQGTVTATSPFKEITFPFESEFGLVADMQAVEGNLLGKGGIGSGKLKTLVTAKLPDSSRVILSETPIVFDMKQIVTETGAVGKFKTTGGISFTTSADDFYGGLRLALGSEGNILSLTDTASFGADITKGLKFTKLTGGTSPKITGVTDDLLGLAVAKPTPGMFPSKFTAKPPPVSTSFGANILEDVVVSAKPTIFATPQLEGIVTTEFKRVLMPTAKNLLSNSVGLVTKTPIINIKGTDKLLGFSEWEKGILTGLPKDSINWDRTDRVVVAKYRREMKSQLGVDAGAISFKTGFGSLSGGKSKHKTKVGTSQSFKTGTKATQILKSGEKQDIGLDLSLGQISGQFQISGLQQKRAVIPGLEQMTDMAPPAMNFDISFPGFPGKGKGFPFKFDWKGKGKKRKVKGGKDKGFSIGTKYKADIGSVISGYTVAKMPKFSQIGPAPRPIIKKRKRKPISKRKPKPITWRIFK